MKNKLNISQIGQDTSYEEASKLQEEMVQQIFEGEESNHLYMVEHAPVYTCGTSTQIESDYIGGNNIPVVIIGRGGKITYHGPGQRVVYPIIDLRERGRDLKKYICDLQKWLISSLKEIGINAYTSDDVGVWVKTPTGEKKIAAIGVRVRKWITFHGIALNVKPDMSHFNAIVPCGIIGKGVTSIHDQGIDISMEEMDEILIRNFRKTFDLND